MHLAVDVEVVVTDKEVLVYEAINPEIEITSRTLIAEEAVLSMVLFMEVVDLSVTMVVQVVQIPIEMHGLKTIVAR